MCFCRSEDEGRQVVMVARGREKRKLAIVRVHLIYGDINPSSSSKSIAECEALFTWMRNEIGAARSAMDGKRGANPLMNGQELGLLFRKSGRSLHAQDLT